MSQNLAVFSQNPGGIYSALNITAATLIKPSRGVLYTAAVNVAMTSGGAFTLNDSNALVTAQTITGITAAANAVVTVSTGGSANPFAVGNTICFTSVGGMTQINTVIGTVTAIGGVTTAWTITTNINSTNFTAWSSGGTCASYGAANEIYTLPEATVTYGNVANFAGNIIALNWPCQNGILVSAVGSASGVFSVAYA